MVFRAGRAAAFLLACLPAGAAAQESASITVRGVVPARCELEVVPLTHSIDLRTGANQLPVARLEERCNLPGGYRVEIASTNGGSLSNGTGGQTTAYTVSYDGVSGGSAGGLVVQRSGLGQGGAKELFVSLPPGVDLPSGAYEDTLVVTVSSK